MTLHKDIVLGEIHLVYNWTYADATARAAAAGLVPDDVGKLARQLDDNSLWLLTDDSPVTWVQVSSPTLAGHNHTSSGGDGGVLTNDEHDGYMLVSEIASPSNPAANKIAVYAEDDGGLTKLRAKDSAGTVYEMGVGLDFTDLTYTTAYYIGSTAAASPIATGVVDGGIYHDHDAILVGWSMVCEPAPSGGSFIVELWNDDFPANYPPDSSDDVLGGETPTVTTGNTTGQDLSLNSAAGFPIAADTYTRFNVDTNNGVDFAELFLHWVRD